MTSINSLIAAVLTASPIALCMATIFILALAVLVIALKISF